jgi:hypothetical protein
MADTLARMRQLIGTTAQWAANDLVIGDGELALERTAAALVLTKVGDGVKRWSQLGYVDFDVPVIIRPALVPNVRRFLSGSGTYNLGYTFVITAGSATAGATYTHNGVTYTVLNTIAGATQIILTGSAAPLPTGTLTKASGTGDATLTFSQYMAPLYLKVTAPGGGGGGGGSGTSVSGGTGTVGGTTTFGISLITAVGGNGGLGNGTVSVGGSATINAPAFGYTVPGGSGSGAGSASTAGIYHAGGSGAPTMFGGGGPGSNANAGSAAIPNTGSGGGGGGNNGVAGSSAGTGGGAGGTAVAIIPNPAATYAYTVGAGGNAGAAGTSGLAGGAGASGVIIVEEHYQ